MRSVQAGIVLAAFVATLTWFSARSDSATAARELADLRQQEADGIRKQAALREELADRYADASRRCVEEQALYEEACKSLDAMDKTLVGTRKELVEVKVDLANTIRVRDTVQAELLASQDRLDKAYQDISEMEKQIVDVSRLKNELTRKNKELREVLEGTPHRPPDPIVGQVLGVSANVNLVLISVGEKDMVHVGMIFRVKRGELVVGTLEVDRVDDSWSACRRVSENEEETIKQGDSVELLRED